MSPLFTCCALVLLKVHLSQALAKHYDDARHTHTHTSSQKQITEHDASNDAWAETTAWMISNGATVTPNIHGAPTQHAGNSVRGVVTTADLPKGNFLEIPSSLWINIDTFPNFRDVRLDQQECTSLSKDNQKQLKVSVGLASESRDTSKFAPYLSNLPTLEDYKAFHPRLADTELLAEFAGLPLVDNIKVMQTVDAQIQRCFKAWRKQKDSPVSDLTWDQVKLALQQFRTRCYGTNGGGSSLIPASDLMNTGSSANLNTEWGSGNSTHFVVATAKPLSHGTELMDSYCPTCDNTNFVLIWGIFLEDNAVQAANKDKAAPDSFCPAIRAKVEEALDTSPSHMAEVETNKWRAPRCKAATMNRPQGPLRCSLARLAWQTCSETPVQSMYRGDAAYDGDGGHKDAEAILSHSEVKGSWAALSDEELVKYLDLSARHRVHPRLTGQQIRKSPVATVQITADGYVRPT